VQEFLRQALAEQDDETRATLIGKATYWNHVALREARTEDQRLANPWGRSRLA
jgi:hypothetical protein